MQCAFVYLVNNVIYSFLATNQRKCRKGAFWEDRYHATANEDEEHLLRCVVYIDLNMVRAGVVAHPREWPHGGYREIQAPRRRFVLP